MVGIQLISINVGKSGITLENKYVSDDSKPLGRKDFVLQPLKFIRRKRLFITLCFLAFEQLKRILRNNIFRNSPKDNGFNT